MPNSSIDVRVLPADEAHARIDELVDVLRDAVDSGSSINFLAHVTDDELRTFWQTSIDDVAAGGRVLIVADTGGRLVGTAMLVFASQQNSRHRADVAKMIVHRSSRRRGLAAQLLSALEAAALADGRTLLMLDTETDSAGDALYRANGWVDFGIVPDHARTPDGELKPTTFFYKHLSSRP
ncbi:MAG: ttr [Ilumatobacteraceae bacterium]|nr:ttr [Ilumatobacteraceae bacterium]